MKERRQHPRLSRWFDGSWRGASGGNTCRVSDISVSGCFVHSLAVPQAGEETVVTIALGPEHALSLTGNVVYVEKSMGFGVKFREISQEDLDCIGHLFEIFAKAAAG